MIRSDADALLRQLRGYIRVYKDPPRTGERQMVESRWAMAELFVSEFTALDEFLSKGGELPEEWDPKMGNAYRARTFSGVYRYLHVPGRSEAACQVGDNPWPCRWLNSDETLSVCQRCHTIRIKVK